MRKIVLASAIATLVGLSVIVLLVNAYTEVRGRRVSLLPEVPAVSAAPVRHGVLESVGLPIAGLTAKDILDTFEQGRGEGRKHEATDILAPMGTPVMAVADGVIKKLFLSKPGGITVYQYDPSETYCFYYAHLNGYVEGLAEGQRVKKGEVIGYVGVSGNAPKNTPHLHFAVFRLGEEKLWYKDLDPVNPYPYLQDALGRQ
ncbi:MAG: M23 family metallopeptidase [Bryobacterales bacterium]|nr:M23 family metallopeptidase [Bryobacterales bacterium]